MRLTTRGRYAVTAMVDLALHGGQGPVTLADIAHRQHISLAYLEQIFARLRRSGLVCSVRGPGGGYRLAQAGLGIAVVDIIDAVDESLDATRCGGGSDCQDGRTCLTHELWSDLSSRIHDFLSGVTLGQIIGRPEIQALGRRQRAQSQTPQGRADDRIDTLSLDSGALKP
ncbi:MAG: Rrf2 family transcriptional regulator [Gammaproteobacteria bacterium]|nr:Rrf2 family transcriptional regulator [Gammaproteobacteria bacterium]